MTWLGSLYSSSIGKKSIMAASGLLLCLFLLAHLMGNAVSFFGRDAFNAYAEKLHSLGALIYVLETGLLVLFLIHIVTGIILYLENLKARPSRYAVNTSEGGRTLGSRFMPYTGAIMTIFIIVHLMNFHFTDKNNILVADLVRNVLSRPGPGLLYIVSLIAVALHLSHGAWSLFQSMGFNHEKYNNVLYRGALAFSIIVGGVFILIPFLALVSKSFLL
jgi:succinate dehydrogenase / fumarate reductase cytochrome b subunit